MGDTGCNLVLLGQYNLVLIGIEWYWVNKGLLCLYILNKINGDVNQLTDQQGEYRAICLFKGWKIEGPDLQYEKRNNNTNQILLSGR